MEGEKERLISWAQEELAAEVVSGMGRALCSVPSTCAVADYKTGLGAALWARDSAVRKSAGYSCRWTL